MSKEFQHPATQTKIVQHFNKSGPAIRKTVFYANHDPNKQKVGFNLA